MLILGIDPGAQGAFVVVDSDTRRIVSVRNMPIWHQLVGKTNRKRVDAIELAQMVETYKLMGVDFVCMEAVGGRGKQPGSAGFVFGYGVGLVYMALVMVQLPIDTIPPHTWKAFMRVPGKGKAEDSAIIQRANELFPNDREKFQGPKGGKQVDVAEAAMLALFAIDFIIKKGYVTVDPAEELAYRTRVLKAETGA